MYIIRSTDIDSKEKINIINKGHYVCLAMFQATACTTLGPFKESVICQACGGGGQLMWCGDSSFKCNQSNSASSKMYISFKDNRILIYIPSVSDQMSNEIFFTFLSIFTQCAL